MTNASLIAHATPALAAPPADATLAAPTADAATSIHAPSAGAGAALDRGGQPCDLHPPSPRFKGAVAGSDCSNATQATVSTTNGSCKNTKTTRVSHLKHQSVRYLFVEGFAGQATMAISAAANFFSIRPPKEWIKDETHV